MEEMDEMDEADEMNEMDEMDEMQAKEECIGVSREKLQRVDLQFLEFFGGSTWVFDINTCSVSSIPRNVFNVTNSAECSLL